MQNIATNRWIAKMDGLSSPVKLSSLSPKNMQKWGNYDNAAVFKRFLESNLPKALETQPCFLLVPEDKKIKHSVEVSFFKGTYELTERNCVFQSCIWVLTNNIIYMSSWRFGPVSDPAWGHEDIEPQTCMRLNALMWPLPFPLSLSGPLHEYHRRTLSRQNLFHCAL